MDCEAERILQISLRKLTDVRQRQCLGSSLRRNLLVSRALDNVLSSTELSYCAYRTDYELEVDIDRVQNERLSLKPSKIRQNQRGTAWTTEVKEKDRKRERKGNDKKRVKGSTRGRQEDVARNKQFKSERVFFYGDLKITVVDEYCMG